MQDVGLVLGGCITGMPIFYTFFFLVKSPRYHNPSLCVYKLCVGDWFLFISVRHHTCNQTSQKFACFSSQTCKVECEDVGVMTCII